MRKALTVMLCLALASLFMVGCGTAEKTQQQDTPAGHPDEVKDTTRMDAADTMAADTAMAEEAEAADTE